MPIYRFGQSSIERIEETTFSNEGVRERTDLQRLLREHIEVISPNTLIISEEFGEWEESRRRIDLLGIDEDANLIVIELKRTEDGGHMDLQAIRYASMVSTLTFDQSVDVFGRHLARLGRETQDARRILLDFLGWDEPDEDQFAQDVRIVLASAEFSKELTSSVLWLLDHDINIRCVRLKPYRLGDQILVDVQQIIPLPEIEEYQIQVREKVQKERQARTGARCGTGVPGQKRNVQVSPCCSRKACWWRIWLLRLPVKSGGSHVYGCFLFRRVAPASDALGHCFANAACNQAAACRSQAALRTTS